MIQDIPLLQKPSLDFVKQDQKPKVRTKSDRIYAMDWLRVLAFGILMIYHTAEVFTTWDWWVKNEETSPLLSYGMMFFHEWRMLLLFIISGAAAHLALGRRSVMTFLQDRVVRILIPLIAAMLLIIPPQIYFIQLHDGENISFWNFYLQLFEFEWFPKGNFHWLHLWYMAFIFAFTVMMLPVINLMKLPRGKLLIKKTARVLSKPVVLFSLSLLMEVPLYLSKFSGFGGNLQSLVYYFPYYVFGALFLTNDIIRQSFVKYRKTAFVLATITACSLYLTSWIKDDAGNALITFGMAKPERVLLDAFLTTLNHWFWLITIIGFGLRYLTNGSTFLQYANKAIAPFYILHQTVIIALAYYIVDLPYDISTKFALIITLTFVSIFLLYQLVLVKTRFTQVLFGIKK